MEIRNLFLAASPGAAVAVAAGVRHEKEATIAPHGNKK
jgi:hypothetical protein